MLICNLRFGEGVFFPLQSYVFLGKQVKHFDHNVPKYEDISETIKYHNPYWINYVQLKSLIFSTCVIWISWIVVLQSFKNQLANSWVLMLSFYPNEMYCRYVLKGFSVRSCTLRQKAFIKLRSKMSSATLSTDVNSRRGSGFFENAKANRTNNQYPSL